MNCQLHSPDFPNRCCCNCTNQVAIHKHPWNTEFGKGKCSEVFGYGCIAFQDEGQIIFFDHPHGMCEMHNRK